MLKHDIFSLKDNKPHAKNKLPVWPLYITDSPSTPRVYHLAPLDTGLSMLGTFASDGLCKHSRYVYKLHWTIRA